ncbi:DUF1667 domain-containing protein [Caproiciproducens sp.]|uniref:DUF1667 domain-containing protein n=1 Tax=Caproiciproducens sp. TaxID=1954376 RepID=UPI00289D49AD|nr:DUF1667 domain-containing protein [Caproiciproducens sp.]
MQEKKIICTVCPIGCNITVRGGGEQIKSMEGFGCKRGEAYARSEFIHPVRILTSTAKVEGCKIPLVPVRSSKPVPKELLFKCMNEIRGLYVKAPVHRYDVLIPNILETGVDIVASGTVE